MVEPTTPTDLRERFDLLVDADPLALREEALRLLGRAEKAERERDIAHRMLERIPDVHMRFGVVGVVDPEDADCADWCYACRLEGAEESAEKAAATVQRVQAVADAMRGTAGTRAWGDRLDMAITGTALRPGLRVHELRTAQDRTLADLATAAGLTRETVRNIETGDTIPLPESLDALAAALGVPRAVLEPPPAAGRSTHMAEHGVAYITDAGRYVVADQGGWLPGTYETADAARLAVTLDHEHLVALRDATPAGRGITVADLRAVLDRQTDAERAHDLSHIPPKETS